MNLELILADDHALFRDGLRRMLAETPGFSVVGEAADGSGALRLLEEHPVDVLLLDLSMPGTLTGAQTAETALAQYPSLAIVVVTMHKDEYYLREMFEIGVRGYVSKNSSPDCLVSAIKAAARGQRYIDPSLTCHVLSGYLGKKHQGESRLHLLTERERQVCRLLAMGYTNAEVGDKLCISVRTVESHRSRMMGRLSLSSRAQLVRFAIDNGLIKVGAP
jgi:two-component system, NarL family, response regulator NreC